MKARNFPFVLKSLIKSEMAEVNSNKILINFADRVKNFHNVDLWGVLGLDWEIGSKLNGGEIRD